MRVDLQIYRVIGEGMVWVPHTSVSSVSVTRRDDGTYEVAIAINSGTVRSTNLDTSEAHFPLLPFRDWAYNTCLALEPESMAWERAPVE